LVPGFKFIPQITIKNLLTKEEKMLDFEALSQKKITFDQLIAGVGKSDLALQTKEMVDRMLNLIKDCNDGDVVFEPLDPEANDRWAVNPADVTRPWTLGHVIVHATASSEEAAALAAEMARGVPLHGRSRSEMPWQKVTTITQCRARLQESQRICLASLEMWPDESNIDQMVEPWPGAPWQVNCIGRFVLGLMHSCSHLDQIADIVNQSHYTEEDE
jgi:hypothetical protein